MEGLIIKVKEKYGFILVDGSRQIFYHISGVLTRGLREGDTVTFDLVQSLKSQYQHQAINVKRIPGPISTSVVEALAAGNDNKAAI